MNDASPGGNLRALSHATLATLETPCFIFDPDIVLEELAALKDALGGAVVVSLKANPVVDLLVRCVHGFVDGVEIASLGELNLTVGRVPVPRFVNTPALDSEFAESAIACRATIVADSLAQLDTILAAAVKRRAPFRLALRVNAASLIGSAAAAKQRTRADHFGMDVADVKRALERLAGSGHVVAGLHTYAGSESFAANAAPLALAMARLVDEVRAHPSAQIAFVNLGGGFPVAWRELGFDFGAYRRQLAELFGEVQVLHEAGRALFSRSGKFVAKVVEVKSIEGKQFAICNGGMAHHFLLAQTEKVVKQRMVPQLIAAAPGPAAAAMVTVAGNTCNRADLIGSIERLPARADFLVYEQCGAYHTYSPKGFLSLRSAAHYIVS